MSSTQNKSPFLFALVLCLLSFAGNHIAAQTSGTHASKLFGRKYKLGETYRYKLTMQEFHNGTWDHTNIATCQLKVVKDSSGIFYDEIRWITRQTLSPKDTVIQNNDALAVKPYRISIAEGGRLDLPKIDVPNLTEPIQDFNTFFVAVSPLVGIENLVKKNDSFNLKDPVKADFSNGASIIKGEDCIAISAKLDDITKEKAMLTTTFSPSAQPCLTYLTPDMNKPVVGDTINNFQMVMQTGQGNYLVQYGREFFAIKSVVRKSDGKIISASMFNKLDLKMKINCKQDYSGCQFEMPFAEERKLTLELLQ